VTGADYYLDDPRVVLVPIVHGDRLAASGEVTTAAVEIKKGVQERGCSSVHLCLLPHAPSTRVW
jgi:hypothetical protein